MTENVRARRKAGYTGILLVVSSLVAKALGAIYRIPLTNILGAEGIGMYQLVFPVYALMLTLASSGIPTAISRLVAEKYALSDEEGVRSIVKTSAILLGVLGAVFVGIMLLLSVPLGMMQGNRSLYIVYMAIAPAVLFVAGSSVLKGYFEGTLNLTPTALTGLAEQVVKMSIGLILSSYLMRYGIVYAVMGAVIGVTLGEAVSFVMILVMYMRASISRTRIHVYDFRHNATRLIRVALPISLSGLVFPLMQVIDSLLIVNILGMNGYSSSRATALYGLLTGPVGTLISMPVVITLALSVMIVPLVSSSRVMRDASLVREKSTIAVKLCFIVCAPAFVGMFLMAGNILMILYPTLDAGDIELATGLLRVSSVSILLLAEVHLMTALMTALDKARINTVILVVGALLKVVFSILLITRLSILGAAIASILTYLFITAVEFFYLRHYLGCSPGLFNAIAKVLVSALIMGLFVLVTAYFIKNIYLSLAVALLVGVAIYTLLMLSLRVMDERELCSLPLGRLLIYMGRRVRFWEKENDRDNRTRNS